VSARGDIESIRQLIARYSQYRDTRRIDDWADCMAEDAVYHMRSINMVLEGRDVIREFNAAVPIWQRRKWVGTHLLSKPVIQVDGDKATARTDLIYVAPDTKGTFEVQAVIRYLDQFARTTGGRWEYTVRDAEILGPYPVRK
jgi:ketosteroid isomerase-like protein